MTLSLPSRVKMAKKVVSITVKSIKTTSLMEKAKSSFQTAATTEELGKMELPTGLVFLAQPTGDVQKASSKMANGKEE